MKRSIKVAIAILTVGIGVVTLIPYFSKQKQEKQFLLVDHLTEGNISYHVDFMDFLDEAISYNSKIEKSLTYRVALSKLKELISKSGLKTEDTYFTYSFGENEVTSIYVEINDTAKFNSTFSQLILFFTLSPLLDSPHQFLSEDKTMSTERYSKYIKVNIGKGSEFALATKKKQSSSKFKKLIQRKNFGVINTTGTPTMDSLDYATFSYSYDTELNLTIDWKVKGDHPAQSNLEDEIELYPIQKDAIRVFTNLDLEQITSTINPFLKGEISLYLEKLPKSVRELLKLWNGKSSIQIGGKSAQKTIQYITEFDDNFNQVEKKIVKIDSIPNIGFYWGTNNPKESLKLLDKLPNIELDNEKLQIALLPPLITRLEKKSMKGSSQLSNYKKHTFKQLLFMNIDIRGIIGEINAEKKDDNTLRIIIKMKDWQGLRKPKNIDISSFW